MGQVVRCDACGNPIEPPSAIHIPPIVCDDCVAKAPRLLQLCAEEAAEKERAAGLWARLVTAWESMDAADDNGESPLLDAIGALVDEWQGFVGKEAKPT